MRWWKKARKSDGGVFLEGTDSDLADFGHTGGDAFSAAWAANPPDPDSESGDDLFDAYEDRASRRSRDLDRRSRKGFVLVGLLVIALAGVGIANQQGLFDEEPAVAANPLDRPNVIGSIGSLRDYETGPAEVEFASSIAVDRAFIAPSESEDPAPVGALSTPRGEVEFGFVFWAGRAHVAVLGADVDPNTDCIVVSLVASDFRVVDLASHGRCGSSYDATGDRVACAGPGLTILEVWPFDPDAVVEQPAVSAVRVRVETVVPGTGAIESLRGMESVDSDFVDNAVPMLGGPGDEAAFTSGGFVGTCTLLDRAEVPVQLL